MIILKFIAIIPTINIKTNKTLNVEILKYISAFLGFSWNNVFNKTNWPNMGKIVKGCRMDKGLENSFLKTSTSAWNKKICSFPLHSR